MNHTHMKLKLFKSLSINYKVLRHHIYIHKNRNQQKNILMLCAYKKIANKVSK